MEIKTLSKEKALSKLTDMSSRREICTGKALELMRRWGVAETDRQEIIAYLLKNRYIDDRRYARFFVRDKVRFSSWGKRKIIEALRLKQIDRAIIEEALREEYREEESRENAAAVLEAKARTVKYKDSHDLRNKLLRFGLSRGFEYDEIRSAIEKIIG